MRQAPRGYALGVIGHESCFRHRLPRRVVNDKHAGGQHETTVAATANKVLRRALQVELGQVQPMKHEQKLSSGAMYPVLDASGELARRAGTVSSPGKRLGNTGAARCASDG